MRFHRHGSVACFCLLLVASAASAFAQIQVKAAREGELWPVVVYTRIRLLVQQGDRRQPPDVGGVKIKPATEFGEGHVEIANIETDYDPLRNASASERSAPHAVRCRFKANLTADRALSNCYGLLTFLTEGSIGTELVPIGTVSTGSPQKVEVELHVRVEKIGTLHIFHEGREVRSNQHPGPYDFTQFYADLMKDQRGLSGAELLKAERLFPHVLTDDGKLLATLRDRDTKTALIVYNLDTMKLVYDQPVAPREGFVGSLNWISDHELVYVARDDWRTTEGKTKLHLLDVKSGVSTEVADNIYSIIESIPDKPDELIVFAGRYGADVMRFNVRTQKTSDEQDIESGSYAFDRSGHARIRIRYDGDLRICEFRPTPTARWQELDRSVKQPGLHFNLRAKDLLDRVADIHSVGPDGDTLYISSRINSDKFELAAFSMSEGVIKRVIAKHPQYDLTRSDDGLSHLLFGRRSTQLLGCVFMAQKPQIVWLEPGFAAVQKAMDNTFPDHTNMPIDWTDDGHTIVYFSSSDQDPGTYYVFRPLESRLIPVFELGARLKGKSLAKTTPIEFAARDGQKIEGYVTRPITPPAKGLPPLLVVVHGGPTARDSWGFNAQNQFFASRGYEVLQVNYRGSSGFGAAFQKAGLYARLDTVVLDDIADGARFLISKGEVDPNRVAITGGSFGGWATYMSLIKYPDLYRAGIAVAAVSSWKKSISDERFASEKEVSYAFWKSLLQRGHFDEDAKFIEPLQRASELKQPIFIIHGERDDVVKAFESKLMLDALRKQNPNVQSQSFPWATHTWWPFEDQITMLNESAVFLDKYLSAPTPAAVSDAAH